MTHVNRYPGPCDRCGQPVAAGAGTLTAAGPGGWTVTHAGQCPPNPHNLHGAPTWELSRGSGYGGYPYPIGQALRESWFPGAGGATADTVPGGRVDDSGRVSGIVTVVAVV